MAAPAPTRSSTPRLSEIARHVVLPAGVTATGWPAVRDKCRDLGISFRPWQHGAGQVVLAKRSTGKYAATIGGTGMSIPRQVGKTFLVGAIVFALCLLFPNLTVIWTAHRLRTAEETFKKMQGLTRRKKIAPHVDKVWTGSGEEEIRFHNGSRILFGARERGFGRGFDEVDVLIFDEAQILTDAALDDMIPATNQSRQPTGALLLYMGTPPKPSDPGEVFTRMRTEALTGDDDDTGWIEFGADEGYEPTPLPAPMSKEDWAQVAKANPSYPQDTQREAILRMRKKLGAESFLREGLGIWVKTETVKSAISWELWKGRADAGAPRGKNPVFGVATAPDWTWAAIAVAWRRPDGGTQVMVAAYRPDATWLNSETKRLRTEWGGRLVCDGASEGRVSGAQVLTTAEQGAAEKALDDAVRAGTVWHGNQGELNTAVRGSAWRLSGTTQVLDRRGSIDITPLRAAAMAVDGLSSGGAVNFW